MIEIGLQQPDTNKPLIKEMKEQITEYGTGILLNCHLLDVILGTQKPNPIFQDLFKNYSIKAISGMTIQQLQKLGLTKTQAEKLNAVFELSRRLETFESKRLNKITSPKDVYNLLFPYYRGQKKEIIRALYLDTKNHVIKNEIISIGSLNASVLHPREVFKTAIDLNSASIILVHNHPSGDPSPSREDVIITEKIKEASKVIGIDFLDHVIIGDAKFKSLKDESLI